MDDRFMNQMRRDPDSKFARSLREKLREQEPSRAMRALRPAPALALAFAAVVVVALFAFPEVRVSAQAMLDLFRVRKFAAVQFDESRMAKLHDLKGDQALMVFDREEALVDPGPPQVFTSVEAAGAVAGFVARRPAFLPNGLAADTVLVQGAGAARLSVSEDKLRALLDVLELRDVSVPGGLDGQVVEVRKSPAVVQQFRGGRWKAALVQSKSPELTVPAGLDMQRLAEVGLRILGLDAGEARRVAKNTDWRSTLVVPVPLNASTFRQITVRGQPGLMITTTGDRSGDGSRRRDGTVVLWTEGDQVFGLMSNIAPEDVLQMAESVQ
ncbi:MAG: hypothetical protein ABIS67_14720 [Candidatus Eisenbacteria bacterium]